jgi:regulator of replication initiation timing
MEKFTESLRKVLPEGVDAHEIELAAEEMIAEVRRDLDAEFSRKLETAYAELSAEKEEIEKTALAGYQEAYAFINEIRNRMELMRGEYERELEKGFEEAYQMIQEEKSKAGALSGEIHEEYDAKLAQVKNFIVDRLDEFLKTKGQEIHESQRRDLLADPAFAEQRVALDKVVGILSDYLSEEDRSFATSSRLEERNKEVESLKAKVRMAEDRNRQLGRENARLNEQVSQAAKVINESRQNEKHERAKRGREATGRGHVVYGEGTVVIAEHNDKPSNKKSAHKDTVELQEKLGDMSSIRLLAGVTKSE